MLIRSWQLRINQKDEHEKRHFVEHQKIKNMMNILKENFVDIAGYEAFHR